MSIKVTCPTCERVQKYADDQAGARVRCQHCDERIVLPGERADADEEEAPPARGRRRTKPASSGSGALWWILGSVGAVLLLFLCIGGGAIFFVVYTAYTAASNIAKDFPGGQPKDLNEALTWLNTGGGRRENAAEWLQKQPVDASQRTTVAAALDKAAQSPGLNTFERGKINTAFAAWAGPENVAALLREFNNDGGGFFADTKIVDALARLKTDQAARGLAKCLDDPRLAGHAADGLKRMGSIAEDPVADMLKSEAAKWEALRILEKIGTKKTVPKVQQAGQQDQSLKFMAEQTIKAMQNR